MSSSENSQAIPKTVPPRIQSFQARLSEKQIYNDIFTLFHFELIVPPRLEFQAGQYILLSVPTTPQKKSYSIASVPAVDHSIELLIDLRPQGDGTKYLGSLQEGDTIEFMAPVGMFTVPSPDSPAGQGEEELYFVATGSGIAPYRSMIEDLLVNREDQRPITLLWGLRHAEHQFWYDDFSVLAEQHQNFEFRPMLSQPPEDWPLDRGRVTDVLLAHEFKDIAKIGFFLCGSSAMIEDARKILEDRGADPLHIHREKFF